MRLKRYLGWTRAVGLVAMACMGCAGASEPTDAADAAAPARGGEEQAAAAASGKQDVSLTGERLDAFERGLKREIEAVRAAGLPVDDYREIRETVNGVFRTLDFQGKIEGPLSMDLSRADAATKERLARDPFDDLPPESAAALRERMNRLVPVWIEYVTLTAVAG